MVWEMTTKQVVISQTAELFDRLEWSADGHTLAVGTVDQHINLWDMPSGHRREFLENAPSGLLAISPDSQMIVVYQTPAAIMVRTIATGQIMATIRHPADRVTALAFHPQGDLMAIAVEATTGPNNPRIELWNWRQPSLVRTFTGNTDEINQIAFSPNGAYIVSGAGFTMSSGGGEPKDTLVRVWEVTSGALLVTYEGHSYDVTDVAWSPDGTTIASSSKDRTIRFWKLPAGIRGK